jgi:hypothetical protein
MKWQGTEAEIADIEWCRVTSIAWPTLCAIAILQVVISENSIERWQILFIAGCLGTLALSYYLATRLGVRFGYTPTFLYLLCAPILVGKSPGKPWISLGLIVIFACIYYSGIENLWIATSVVTLLTILQVIVAKMNLASFTDNEDLSLLYGYFSSVYIFVIGIASIFIRRQYFSVAHQIGSVVEKELENSYADLKKQMNANEFEEVNLKLHGTILNTLIYLRNTIANFNSVDEIKKLVRRDVETLSLDFSKNIHNQLHFSLQKLIDKRTLNRIKIDVREVRINNLENRDISTCLEILRELILNLEKHTNVSQMSIRISQASEDFLNLEVLTDLYSQNRDLSNDLLDQGIRKSKNLKSILNNSNSTLTISLHKSNGGQKITILFPIIQEGKYLSKKLAEIRLFGLNDFALNYIRAGALVAALSLPGYFIYGVNLPTKLILSTITSIFICSLWFRSSKALLGLLGILSMLLIPAASYRLPACRDISTLPWMFNLLLAVSFYFSISRIPFSYAGFLLRCSQ